MQLKHLGRQAYAPIEAAMRNFTAARAEATPDELWLVEHEPVFTQGLAGKPEHVRAAGGIAVVQTDRGGQVTYHGPGQLVVYPLVDLRRSGHSVRGRRPAPCSFRPTRQRTPTAGCVGSRRAAVTGASATRTSSRRAPDRRARRCGLAGGQTGAAAYSFVAKFSVALVQFTVFHHAAR